MNTAVLAETFTPASGIEEQAELLTLVRPSGQEKLYKPLLVEISRFLLDKEGIVEHTQDNVAIYIMRRDTADKLLGTDVVENMIAARKIVLPASRDTDFKALKTDYDAISFSYSHRKRDIEIVMMRKDKLYESLFTQRVQRETVHPMNGSNCVINLPSVPEQSQTIPVFVVV